MNATVTHPKLVKALAKSGDTIAAEITGADAHLMHMAIGIAGEAGELLDAVKKRVIYRQELDMANVLEELGDLEFFLEGLRQAVGVSREDCIKGNITKLLVRYNGMKYSDAGARSRNDKVPTSG